MTSNEFKELIQDLSAHPNETEWLEFKHNNFSPQQIGENISALSNSAALLGNPIAYIVWGVEDKSHNIVGTTFQPYNEKIGNEELENWLTKHLSPRIDFRITEGEIDEKHIVLFEIPPAPNTPVRFGDFEYIRNGSYTKKLRDFSEKERNLWKAFNTTPFETGVAKGNVSDDEVLALIDYPKYFKLMGDPLPENKNSIIERFLSEKIIFKKSRARYDISNVGAILFALNLSNFDRISRKALRVIIYNGRSRVETIREQAGAKGYAVGFTGATDFINDQLPQNEQINKALRTEVRMFPEIAIRELIANALIHQDFSITGAGPMVEIFSDRIEISNPGEPLIDTLRFIDEPPRSRNETLASLMRRMGICEERGSGIDKVISSVEMFQLPAPDFRVSGRSTVSVLYGPRDFSEMDKRERIRACYQHACLRSVFGERMTNASLRERLGIKKSNYPLASRIIKDTFEERLIKSYSGESGSKRDSSYIPFWA